MNRHLLAAAGAMALASCSYLNTPSDRVMKQCLAMSGDTDADVSLDDLVKWAKAKGHDFEWVHDRDAIFVFRLNRSGGDNSTGNRMALEIENSDRPSNSASCGPGWARITRTSVNDEILPGAMGQDIGRAILQSVREFVHGAPKPVGPSAADHMPIPPPSVTDGNEADEAAADAEYYAQQSMKAAKRPLSLVDRGGNRFFGWTVERLIGRLTEGGAKAQLDAADNGTVWVTIDDSARRWNGWGKVEFELRNTPAIPNGLIIVSMKADDRVVATLNGGPTPEDLLKPVLPLQ